MHTDPIADFLTRIRNGIMAGHEAVVIPASSLKERLSAILKQEGYIHSYRSVEHEGRDYLVVNLKWLREKENVIHGIKRVSRPGLRVYAGVKEIPEVNGILDRNLRMPGSRATRREACQVQPSRSPSVGSSRPPSSEFQESLPLGWSS